MKGANGQYRSLQDNSSQCLTIALDNIGQYLNVHNNIKTEKRVRYNSHLNNIEQYFTILDNIG